MEMRLSKSGFAFTFLAFFLSMVIFAFIHLSVMEGEYTKENVFMESRISFIDNELKYFKNTYFPNAVSFTLYNALAALEDYARTPANYAKFEGNYTRFNEFLFEGITNGSFDGTSQAMLHSKNITINYFVDMFSDDFNQNFKGNFSFEILNMNVYEERPYYVTARFYVNLTATTEDNISSWSSLEYIDVAVPIYELHDPLFLLMENEEIVLSASEYNFPAQNWTIVNFEEAILNTYSTVYYEPNHMYTLGDSFINRFLNTSSRSYFGVLGFWSFDYDVEKGGVYDSATYSNLSYLKGNTRLIYDFDNNTILGGQVPDLSDYESNGTINGANCDLNGIYKTGCRFDGVNDYIIVPNSEKLNATNKVSVSTWAKISSLSPSYQGLVVSDWSTLNGGIYLGISPLGDGVSWRWKCNGGSYGFDVEYNFTQGMWYNIAGTFDLQSNVSKVFVNGFLIDKSSVPTSCSNLNLENDFFLGSNMGTSEFFNGTLDEAGIYSKVLADSEVAKLYSEKRVINLDYIDSFHGKGIFFDGFDDKVVVENNSYLDIVSDMSIDVWFKSSGFDGGNQTLVHKFDGSDGYGVDIVDRNVGFFVTTVGSGFCSCRAPTILNANKWYLFTGIYDRGTGNMYSYVNGKLVNNSCACSGDIETNNEPLVFGGRSDVDADFFLGVIDEVKLYNYTLSKEQVSNNYYNYDSFAKGCCNYITLIVPHKFGYNDPLYRTNTSYSSKMFYNYHRRGLQPDIVLWNISTITSYNAGVKYYNFILDQCMVEAYNVLDYMNETLNVEYSKMSGVDRGNCAKLVEYGFY